MQELTVIELAMPAAKGGLRECKLTSSQIDEVIYFNQCDFRSPRKYCTV